MIRHLFSVIFWSLYGLGIGQADSLVADEIQISIITCAPGADIYSIYGHNAIRILDKSKKLDLVYNYGTFDFQTKGFVLKFMRGKLPYTLDVAEYDRFLMEYNYFQRSVTEQVLDLDASQKKDIIDYLAVNMQAENRTYKYDFFMDNCATRLRDIIDKNVKNNQWDTSQASHKTFRQIIKEYQAKMPWLDFGVDLIIGAPADKKTTLSQETFIPDYLATSINHAKLMDHRLLQKENKVLTFEPIPNQSFFLGSPYFVFFILLLLEINILFRYLQGKQVAWLLRYDQVWVSLISMASILMIFMWFGTDHIPTNYNWNILWASPLVPLYWLFKNKNKVISYILLACLSLTIINSIPSVQVLPQFFHPIVGIISLILILKGYRLSRQAKVYS